MLRMMVAKNNWDASKQRNFLMVTIPWLNWHELDWHVRVTENPKCSRILLVAPWITWAHCKWFRKQIELTVLRYHTLEYNSSFLTDSLAPALPIFFSVVLQDFYQKGLVGKRAPPDLKAELTDRLEHHFLLTVSPPLHSSFSTRHFHKGIWHEHPSPSSPADARTLFPLQLHTAAPPGRPPRPLCDAPRRSGPEGTEGAEALPTQPHRRAPALRLRSPRAAAKSPPAPAEKPSRGGPRAQGLLPRPQAPAAITSCQRRLQPPCSSNLRATSRACALPTPPPLPPRLAHAQGGKGSASVPGGVEHVRSRGGVARAQRSRRACGRRRGRAGGAQLGRFVRDGA